jgi:hypothetical protein
METDVAAGLTLRLRQDQLFGFIAADYAIRGF